MQTAIGHPDDNLQKEGEVCKSCYRFWRAQGLPFPLMQAVRKDGEVVTTDEGVPIVVCPHCDGGLILRLKK